jgi:hypothetical protein
MNNKRIRNALLAATTALAIATAAVSAAPAIPELKVSVTAEGFAAPLIAQSGFATFNLNNGGKEPTDLMLGLLNEGVTFEALQEAFQKDPGAALGMIQMGGGVTGAMPGGSAKATVDLKAGTYAVVVGGQFKKLVVTPRQGEAPEAPQAAVKIGLKDFAFEMPDTIKAGEQVWGFQNNGKQPHEFIIVKLAPGKTIEDVKTALTSQDQSAPPPFEMFGGALPVGANFQQFVTINLAPGEYYALCFIPDFEGGKPSHVHAGMVKQFKVQ